MGFNRIFLGVLFFIDFRWNGFDVIPDFIGYILIISGLNLLAETNENFTKARSVALPLAFLSLLDIYQVNRPGVDFYKDSLWYISVLFAVAFTVINMIMVYRICQGIQEKAAENDDTELDEIAAKRWTLYALYNIGFIIGIIIPVLLITLFWVYVIFSLVTYFLFLNLLKMAEDRLQTEE